MSEQESDQETGPPAASSAEEAAQQAQAIRARMDRDLKVLEERLPPTETMQAQAKAYGGAAAAGLATLGAAGLVLKQRMAKRAEEKETQRQAEALARALPEAALRVRQQHVHVSSRAEGLGLLVALAALGVALWTRFGPRRGEGS